jgi:hypothetical protein
MKIRYVLTPLVLGLGIALALLGLVSELRPLAAATVSPHLAQEDGLQLPADYAYEVVYRPPLAGLSGIVASHGGSLYVRHLGPTGGGGSPNSMWTRER